MDRALEENLGLSSLKLVEDEAGGVLGDHARSDTAVDEVEHLRRARVSVRCVHTTRAEEGNSHRNA